MKKTQNFIFKKAFVVLMALIMVFTYMPSMAWAESLEDSSAVETLSQNAQEQLTQEETIHVQQDENQTAESFKGTAEHGYVKDISFGDGNQTEESIGLKEAMKYNFNPTQTEYSMSVTDVASLYIQWQGMSGAGELGLKANVAVYDENTGKWQTIARALDVFGEGKNGVALGSTYSDIDKRISKYDKPALIRLAIGKTTFDGTLEIVDLESADIYYYSIVQEASLKSLNTSMGTSFSISPKFDKFSDSDTYYVYGKYVEDTEVKLALKKSDSPSAKSNRIYVNGELYTDGESSKALTLWSDLEGKRYAKIEVFHLSDDGETEIKGRTYKVYFLNEEKITFSKQPIGGTFQPQSGQMTTLSVDVDVPEGAKATYKWFGSKYVAKTDSWSTPNQIWLNGKTDKNTWETSALSVNLNNAMRLRCYCQVTLTVNGESYVANSEVAEVVVKSDGTVSAPFISKVEGNISRTYYQGENAVQLTARYDPIDKDAVATMQWYVSENVDGSNPVKIQTESIKGTEVSGCVGAVTPDTSKAGTFYYYCVGICSLEKDGKSENSEPTKSEIVKIEVKEIDIDLKGDGTKDNPYLIESYDDFVKIQKAVNVDGITFANRYLKLTAEEITLPADWKGLGCNDESKWAPYVSGLKPFSGTLNGCGNLIKMEAGCEGFIKYARDAVVRNLNLYGEKITKSALLTELPVDYGLDRMYGTGCPSPITAENITLKSGSMTKQSGLIGGGGSSGANTVYVKNCIIEDGVIVGYDKDRANIGSFVNCLNGYIINSSSAADVYGTSSVGGLAGSKGQSMGACQILSSSFIGSITATGKKVGGIMGSGYESESAPNSPVVSIINCYVDADIVGNDYIGGIFGSEGGVYNCWENGTGSIDNNSFYGTITATKTDAKYVGGIVGFLRSLNKNQGIDTNYYLDTCGTDKGIGMIERVYTTGKFAVEKDFNVEKHCTKASAEEFQNRTVLEGLQAGSRSYKNWKQGEKYPVHNGETVLYALELSGNYKTKYETGEKLDTTGMVITGKLSDGSTRNISLSDENLKFTGFKSNQRGVQTITVTYGVAKTTFDVTVLYKPSEVKNISVYFTLLGDTKHGEPTEATGTHTLKDKNLPETWVERTSVDIDNNTTVYDVMKKVFNANGITWEESNKRGTVYIESLTRSSVILGEFDNGQLSGWMYTLNGHHSNLGVAQQFLNDKDEIIFHYTDDYTVEEGSDHWNTPGGVVEEVKDVTTDTKAGTTTAPTEVKVSEKTNADGTKTKVAEVKVSADNQKEILKQAKANKSKEIILNVSSKSVGDATKADVTLDKSFIDSIVKDTDAKLTIKTPFGDKTYTQEELKAMSATATGSTVTVAIEKAVEQPTDDTAANIAKAKSVVKNLKLTARSSKTAKKNIKAVLKSDAKVNASIKELKDLGFTVKYRFYRSTKKAASYKSTVTKKAATYTNTAGKKGTKYFYKVQVRVYDENGKLVAKTALKQCKYASRTWTKAK